MSKQVNTSKQSLQKFTELRTREDFIAFKENSTNEEFKSYAPYIQALITESLQIGSPEKNQLEFRFNCLHYWYEQIYPEKDFPDIIPHYRRMRWQINKEKIERAIRKHILDYNRLPSNNEIESRTGLSRQTVYKHIKEGTGADYYTEDFNQLKLLRTSVLSSLYTIGLEDRNVKALKVFLDYTGGAPNTTPTTIKQQNNYLQINNTRIDEVTVNSLPEEARLQIEGIIKQYQTV